MAVPYHPVCGSWTNNRSHVNLDFKQAEADNEEFLVTRSEEKAELQELNARFAVYIDTVRSLEHQNSVLQQELNTIKGHFKQGQASRASIIFQQKLREMKHEMEATGKERDKYKLKIDHLTQDLNRLNHRLVEETKKREEAEKNLEAFHQDVDDATLSCQDLQRKIDFLENEIKILNQIHDEEIREMQGSVQTQQLKVEVDSARPDLTGALRKIRTQYETVAMKNMQESEDWYKSKFADLTESAKHNTEALRKAKREAQESSREILSLNCDITALKNTNESLSKKIREMEEQFDKDIGSYQDKVGGLEDKIRNMKEEMAQHLRAYKDLFNVKMALDMEILTYRNLLEGEEGRINIPNINMSDLLRGRDNEDTPES